MMKLLSKVLAAALLLAFIVVPTLTLAAGKPASCASCHADFASVLPKSHVPVKGKELGACLACHKPDAAKAAVNRFAAGLHRAHASGKADVECTVCHVARGKGAVAIVGAKVALPVKADALKDLKRVMQSWATPKRLDGLHGKANVDCGGCHGGVPRAGDEVANDRCLACHAPLEQLVAKTRPAQFADRNPHESHLGPIACTACHKGHEPSAVYCLDCHKKFEMRIVGAQ